MFRVDLLLIVVLVLCPTTAPASGFEGIWVGRCRIAGAEMFVLLRLRDDASGIKGTAFSRVLGVRNAGVSDVQTDGNRVALSFATVEGTVHLSCELREDALEGTAECHTSKGPCAFRRLHEMPGAALKAFRGDYQLAPDHVVFVFGGQERGNGLFLVDED